MAFDRPIEADRIDDFNLFSAFVRAPLWLLGGVLGVHKSNTCSSEDEQLDGALPPLRNENQPPTNPPSSLQKHHDDSGRVTLATVASEDGSSSCSCVAADQPVTDSLLGGRRKNLSWSDESGKSLVEYNDEVRNESFALFDRGGGCWFACALVGIVKSIVDFFETCLIVLALCFWRADC